MQLTIRAGLARHANAKRSWWPTTLRQGVKSYVNRVADTRGEVIRTLAEQLESVRDQPLQKGRDYEVR